MPGIDLSLEKAAQFFGCDPRTIHRWLRDGCPGKKDARGRWSLNSAEIADWLRQRERESTLGEVASVDEAEARRRKTVAEAAREEFKLAKEQGSAVAIADFEATTAALIGASRAKLLNLGAKLGPLVIQCSTPAEAKDVIDNGVREVLRELSEFDDSEVHLDNSGTREPEGECAEGGEPVGTAPGSDHQRVGRRKPPSKSRSQR